jgi:hypothetical protein
MTPIPLPLKLPLWILAKVKIEQSVLRGIFGNPHFTETDSTRTYGGDEDAWGFRLESGQRLLVVYQVPYENALLYSDSPELLPILAIMQLSQSDQRLEVYNPPLPAN